MAIVRMDGFTAKARRTQREKTKTFAFFATSRFDLLPFELRRAFFKKRRHAFFVISGAAGDVL